MVDGPPADRPRLLIFVIAYYAEDTLTSVLERIPRSIFDEYDCEVLVVDDASEDRTFEIGREYRGSAPRDPDDGAAQRVQPGLRRQPEGRLRVRDPRAASTSWRMVHGDGQYAPEELPELVAPLARRARPTRCSAAA